MSGAQEWPALPQHRLAEVLVPDGFDCAPTAGPGDFRLTCAGTEVWFAAEPPGWQVVVEGALADSDGFLDQVTHQIGRAVGEPCEWLEI